MVKFSVVALSFFIFFSPAGQAASQKSAPSLPAPIQKALNSCKVPKGDFSLSVIPLTDKGTVLKFNSAAPRVPASSAKVITSAAALQLLDRPRFGRRVLSQQKSRIKTACSAEISI